MRARYTQAWAAVAAVLGVACQSSQGSSTAEDEAELVRVVNVEVTPAAKGRFTDYLRITGDVEAMHDVTLSAEESGRLAVFRVEKGAAVARGQVIAELDDEVLRAQVAEATAAADLAREQYERQRQLWEVERIGSEIAFLQAKANAEAAAARRSTLEARLARTKIRTPVSGVFDVKYAEVGEMAMPGIRVARIVSTRQVKVTAGVPERDALAVGRGESVRVTFDAMPGEELTGRIGYVGATVDSVNRTVPIEVVLDNPGGRIKPRMVANVQVARAQLLDVIVVPQQVVLRSEIGYEVFVVVDEDGRPTARSRPVTLGPSYANQVVVREGLAPGDRVITLGQQLVDDGSRVRVVTARSAAPASGDTAVADSTPAVAGRKP
jgi:membrane fusion protein, multidrug efflux system